MNSQAVSGHMRAKLEEQLGHFIMCSCTLVAVLCEAAKLPACNEELDFMIVVLQ